MIFIDLAVFLLNGTTRCIVCHQTTTQVGGRCYARLLTPSTLSISMGNLHSRMRAIILRARNMQLAGEMNEDKVVRVYRRICVDEENEEWNTVAVPSRCTVKDIFSS